MNLWSDFLSNDGKVIHKWVHYFPIYERHFKAWQSRTVTFFEIGVCNGGSLEMWQRFFGPYAKIVGIDIDPRCKQHEAPGISVRIGDQSDTVFLQDLLDEFGAPDIVLDDGSHQMQHVRATFDFLYPHISKNGVYMVEDMHTAYWEEFGGGTDRVDTFISFAKSCVDRLNADHARGSLEPDLITKETLGISFYDSIVCFEKGQVLWKDAPRIGTVLMS